MSKVGRLMTHDYKLVADISIPDARPEVIEWKGRVFFYYYHTTVVGAPDESTHPYREVEVFHASDLVLP